MLRRMISNKFISCILLLAALSYGPVVMAEACIQAGEDIRIGDENIINQGSGDVNVQQCSLELKLLTDSLLKQDFSTQAINSFFQILKLEHVPPTDYEKKLQEIAQSFRELKERFSGIQTGDEGITALKDQADAAIDEGQFAEAKKLLDQAEQTAMDSYVENRLLTAAEIAATKGALARTQLQYLAMGEAYEGAANKMGALGEKHFEKWSEYLNWAGWGFEDAGKYGRSEPLYEKALGLREKHLPQNHNDIATSLNNLANLYRLQGRYDEAEPLYQRSLSIIEEKLSKDHLLIAKSLNNLAALYESQGSYEKAEPLYRHSLSISEKVLGKDHPEVATTLNNLAALYESQGRYDEAEPLYQRSLSIIEEKLGKDHPVVAKSLNNLAGLYQKQGRYDEAGPLLQRSLSISEDKLDKNHPDVATTLNNLGTLSFYQGKLQQSADYLEQALTILKKTFGDEHPSVKTMQKSLDYVKQQIQN